MTTKVTSISHDDLVNLFSTACYGNPSIGTTYDHYTLKELPDSARSGKCYEDVLADLILAGKSIKVIDANADGEVYGLPDIACREMREYEDGWDIDMSGCIEYTITLNDIIRGLSTEKGHALATKLFVDETGDMWTAYNLMQIILFGELIYC